jgi:hypothetical protein
MLYTPVPGTPLYDTHRDNGSLLDTSEMSPADMHGQFRFNYRHPHIPGGREEAYLLAAFRRDFQENGPSLARLIRTLLTGWQRYKDHPEPRIRERYRREVAPLRTTYAGAVWAMRRYYRHHRPMYRKMHRLLADITAAFGWPTRAAAVVTGIYAYAMIQREESRLAAGWRYEPATVCEKNPAALAQAARHPITRPVSAPARTVQAAATGGE